MLAQSDLPNSIGIFNDIINNNTPFYPMDVQLGWNLNRIKSD